MQAQLKTTGGRVAGGDLEGATLSRQNLRRDSKEEEEEVLILEGRGRGGEEAGKSSGELSSEQVVVTSLQVNSKKVKAEEEETGKRGPKFKGGVLDPSGSLCYHWSMVVSFAFLYNFWSLSYRFAFEEIDLNSVVLWFALDYSADLIYLLDVVINFRTGYLEDGVLQRNIDKIGQHYRECTLFYLDCFCLLPLDFLYLSIGFNSILRCTRLVKIYKFWAYVDRTERHTNYPNVFRTFTLVHYILVIFHWNACLFHMISKNKLIDIESMYKINDNRCDDIPCQYLHAFYWSTLALTTIGDLPKPRTKGEYIYVTTELFFGLFLFASVLGHVANIVTNVSASRKEFQAKLDAVKTFMRMRRVSDELQNKVIRWFDYLWVSQKSSDEERSVACLPDRLKAEIAIHVHLDTLKRVDIFQNTEAGFLCELVLRLKPVLFSPGDYVCRKNEVGHEMYIVSRGILEVVTDEGKTVVATLKAGSYFGEISVLNVGLAGNKRTASVRSVGYSDLFCLNKQDLWDVLKNYPNAEMRIRARAEERLSKLDINQTNGNLLVEGSSHQHHHDQISSNGPTGSHRRRVCSSSSWRPRQTTGMFPLWPDDGQMVGQPTRLCRHHERLLDQGALFTSASFRSSQHRSRRRLNHNGDRSIGLDFGQKRAFMEATPDCDNLELTNGDISPGNLPYYHHSHHDDYRNPSLISYSKSFGANSSPKLDCGTSGQVVKSRGSRKKTRTRDTLDENSSRESSALERASSLERAPRELVRDEIRRKQFIGLAETFTRPDSCRSQLVSRGESADSILDYQVMTTSGNDSIVVDMESDLGSQQGSTFMRTQQQRNNCAGNHRQANNHRRRNHSSSQSQTSAGLNPPARLSLGSVCSSTCRNSSHHDRTRRPVAGCSQPQSEQPKDELHSCLSIRTDQHKCCSTINSNNQLQTYWIQANQSMNLAQAPLVQLPTLVAASTLDGRFHMLQPLIPAPAQSLSMTRLGSVTPQSLHSPRPPVANEPTSTSQVQQHFLMPEVASNLSSAQRETAHQEQDNCQSKHELESGRLPVEPTLSLSESCNDQMATGSGNSVGKQTDELDVP